MATERRSAAAADDRINRIPLDEHPDAQATAMALGPPAPSVRTAVPGLESDRTFEADTETEEMLLRSIAQCNEGRTTPMADVLSEMRDRE